MKESLKITSPDGFAILATGYMPEQWNGKVILINSATGVKQSYYQDFSLWLADHGFRVFTYDYRGIGESRPKNIRGFNAYMHEWGILDYHGVLKYLLSLYPEASLCVIGHCVGGQLIGMSPLSEKVDLIVTVGSQSPFWKHFSARKKLLAFWYLVIPMFTKLFGYFPASKLRLFEDLPAEVALEWARWAKREEFLFEDMPFMKDRFNALQQSALMISFSDDNLAPKPAVDHLKQFYQNLKWNHWHLKPDDILQKEIGHFGFFKKKFSSILWADVLQWINKPVMQSTAA